MAQNATHGVVDELVSMISERALAMGVSIGIAESLTGGQLSLALAAGTDSGRWYRGAVVAYHETVKFEVLRVPRGPVVNARTAHAMAAGVKSLLNADISVGVTGVGGPGYEEEQPPGTVFLCALRAGHSPQAAELRISGEPLDVLQHSVEASLSAILNLLDGATADVSEVHGSPGCTGT